MNIPANEFKREVDQLLDRVIRNGETIIIEKDGHRIKLQIDRQQVQNSKNKLSKLKSHDVLVGDPNAIVHMDWSDYLDMDSEI